MSLNSPTSTNASSTTESRAANDKKRYAIVGLGSRARVYIDAIADKFSDACELVGFCDLSRTRMAWHNARLKEDFDYPEVPTYLPDEFEKMIAGQKVNAVIVTTVDALHHEYIIRAMNAGCDVIVEKPMTIDAPKARAILEAIERTGRDLRVTFNMRYTPLGTKLRELIMSGVIGEPMAVNFNWALDTRHGADYFRRWHRDKATSGGLLIHKSAHHFDYVNWLIDSYPERVFALGGLKFYGREAAEARGESYDYERYTGVEAAANDPFALNLEGRENSRALYLEAEADSGYIRDRNVFGEGVTIEDTISISAQYKSGVLLNYSLIAYSPKEGFTLTLTGNKGRIEVVSSRGSHLIMGQTDEELAAEMKRGAVDEIGQSIRVYPMFGRPYDVEIPTAEGGHGGSDPIMFEHIFSGKEIHDPYNRIASYRAGVASILMGIAANESMQTGLPVNTADLIAL
jgi:predicted dehydrogenase